MTTSSENMQGPLGLSAHTRYARFPRRLNALSTDSVLLSVVTFVAFALAPQDDGSPLLRSTLAIVWWSALLFYEPVTVAWLGGTLGHRLLNLRVVDDHSGGNIGLWKAVLRFWIKALLGVLSFLTLSWTRRHQALHDVLTRSTVQFRDPSRAEPHHYVLGRGTSRSGAV